MVEEAGFAGAAAGAGALGAGAGAAAAVVLESEDDSLVEVAELAVAPLDALDDEPRLSFL